MGDGRFSKKRGGRGNGGTPKNTTTEKKAAVMEFAPHTAGKHQSVTYDAVKEHILLKMQKEMRHGHDLVKNLQLHKVYTDVPIVKPERKVEPTNKDADAQKIAQEGLDMEWQIDRKEYTQQKYV